MLPMVLPPTVIGFYLLIALGPNGPGGPIAGLWGARTLAFSFEGLVIGSILYSLPFVFFVILLVVFFGRNFVLLMPDQVGPQQVHRQEIPDARGELIV